MLRTEFKSIFFLTVFCLFIQAVGGCLYIGGAEASSMVESPDTNVKEEKGDVGHEEEEWFRTFLEGTFYIDGWHEIRQDILAELPEAQRDDYSLLINELGEKIGREWAKSNDIRRIDNSQLIEWGDRLKEIASEEPNRLAETIHHINGEVETLLD